MIRRTITRPLRRLLEVRRPAPGELGRLLDAHAPGSRLVVDGMGDRCWWAADAGGSSTAFDVLRLTAEAAAAGLTERQLAEHLARLDVDPAAGRALELAAGRTPGPVPSEAARRREAARQAWPHLVVRPSPRPRRWWWEVIAPDGRTLAPLGDYDPATSELPTQQAALEVGLAHLAVTSASWALDTYGASLPAGVERIPAA